MNDKDQTKNSNKNHSEAATPASQTPAPSQPEKAGTSPRNKSDTGEEPIANDASQYDLDIHPLAKMFPPLSVEEMQELAESVKKQGLLEPITLHEAKVLDGAHRLQACRLAGIPVQTKLLPPDADPVGFVIAKNIQRRHLTASQRATLAAEAMDFFKKGAAERKRLLSGARANPDGTKPGGQEVVKIPPPAERGKARDKAAAAFGVSPKMVTQAVKLKKENPELYKEVQEGGKTIGKATNKSPRSTPPKREVETPAQSEPDQMNFDERWRVVEDYLDAQRKGWPKQTFQQLGAWLKDYVEEFWPSKACETVHP